ncbi:hypothetical protein GV791_04235 [Nocardia cyriacigeorgica]|uniref:Uncharacterized protein n=1 Tax=Nocardia cyriacigeorgica TaxID=135487 RepID=A0A6P1CGP6_9NOCA|nr:hypothetical protein [Nocardia cyriacigeorgica]MBF6425592.1 hypothetical protein [Nocardia cyriacigeorgica]NEW31769.1 hypothetical protein [Nocardia cyriacigeorgica]
MKIATWLEAIEAHPSIDATTYDIAGYIGLLDDAAQVYETGYLRSQIDRAIGTLVGCGFFRYEPDREELVFTLP